MCGQVAGRGANHALLLAPRHRCGCAAEILARAIANFDEDQYLAIAHDQVDFAVAIAYVGIEWNESALLQET